MDTPRAAGVETQESEESMRHIKVGTDVDRCLAGGAHFMVLRVTAVDDRLIHCGAWKFDRDTGGEVDAQLGWNGRNTGTYIVERDP
jgi:hypothetical protein